MFRDLLFLYAETPVHVGADASLGALDLPIQREVTTALPIIKAESLKGALRERFRPPPGREKAEDRKRWVKIFGAEPPTEATRRDEPLKPGTLRVHEAQLVAFPVPALASTFVWATSPLARARLDRKASLANVAIAPPDGSGPPVTLGPSQCLTSGDTYRRQYLGPYKVEASKDEAVKQWGVHLAQTVLPDLPEMAFFAQKLADSLFVCSDDLLGALSRDCAPVVARVQLGTGENGSVPRKTVQHGPFYSEYLPAETILAALLECDDAADLGYVRDHLQNEPLRIGGDETLGKGLMWCRIPDGQRQNHDPERSQVAAAP